MKIHKLCALLAAVTLTASAAFAGPADSPVPSISASAPTRALFIAAGVIKNNGLETDFMCTSLDIVPVTVAVEIFDPVGGGALNDVSSGIRNGTLTIPAGGAATISTGPSAGLHEDLSITGLSVVKNGSARILATSTRVVCEAMVADKVGVPPATLTSIKLFSRRTQDGD